MIKEIKVKEGVKLEDYEQYATLASAVTSLVKKANHIVPQSQRSYNLDGQLNRNWRRCSRNDAQVGQYHAPTWTQMQMGGDQ